MSQIFYLGPSFIYDKNWETFHDFFKYHFLSHIKQKLGSKLKI